MIFSGFRISPEFLLCVLEAVCNVVYGLVLLILVGLHGGECGLEGAVLGLVTDGVEELAVGREQTGAVGLHLVVLLAKTELNREPVHLRAQKLSQLGVFTWEHRNCHN